MFTESRQACKQRVKDANQRRRGLDCSVQSEKPAKRACVSEKTFEMSRSLPGLQERETDSERQTGRQRDRRNKINVFTLTLLVSQRILLGPKFSLKLRFCVKKEVGTGRLDYGYENTV